MSPATGSNEVARQIENAFRAAQYPGDHFLTEGGSSEAADIAEFLRGRRWQDLKIEELAPNHESIFFMSPEALRYYLPAFLLAGVLQYENAGQIPSSLIFLLRPAGSKDPTAEARFRRRFGPLSNSQRRAIRAFLEYLRDNHSEDFPTEGGEDEPSTLLRWWT